MSEQQRRSTDVDYIGVDIGGTKISVCLGGQQGQVDWNVRFDTKGNPGEVLDDIHQAITEAIGHANRPVGAIGIACGGPLDSARGIIQSPPNLPGWDNIPIVQVLTDAFHVPVYLENDANACALAEWYWGNGKGFSSVIFLTFGTGLGAGLILDGRLYRGVSGLSGEVGHWRLSSEGPTCYGKQGSWESFCSGAGISRLYEAKTGRLTTAKEICDLAERHDLVASHVIQESAVMLGRGLALLVDLLNPERIIIGSIFSRSEALFRETMERELRQEALTQTASRCSVTVSALQERLGDMAALGIARNYYKEYVR
jgi:glucokinase